MTDLSGPAHGSRLAEERGARYLRLGRLDPRIPGAGWYTLSEIGHRSLPSGSPGSGAGCIRVSSSYEGDRGTCTHGAVLTGLGSLRG
ncbi:hypothetical protein BX281_5479 [Streptomyces sp. Ag82_O1-15]|nr:hypothetical protein BX281_5479 [Streptomyces sp. Ag82_O1-15]